MRVPDVLAAIREIHFRAPFKFTHSRPYDCQQGDIKLSRRYETPTESSGPKTQLLASKHTFDTDQVERYLSNWDKYWAVLPLDQSRFGVLAQRVGRLLAALPDNQLLGLRWNMGLCSPFGVWNKTFLEDCQRNLRKLSLVALEFCGLALPSLHNLKNLQELSLAGMFWDRDSLVLKQFFECCHEQLTSLEIDFDDWDEVANLGFSLKSEVHSEIDDVDPLTSLILPDREDGYLDFLPNLRRLSLTGANFKESNRRVIDAFNIAKLKEIKSIRGDAVYTLLAYAAQSIDKILFDARKVELVVPHLDETEELVVGVEPGLCDILAPFHDLEDLFLMFETPESLEEVALLLYRSSRTLRRLVLHIRSKFIHATPPETFYHDNPLSRVEDNDLTSIMGDMKLECLGLCASTALITDSFFGTAPITRSLKLLHLRFTGDRQGKPRVPQLQVSLERCDSLSSTDIQNILDRVRTELEARDTDFGLLTIQDMWDKVNDDDCARQDQLDMEDFASWAFGPRGFPNLRVLASGDFSHSGRFENSCSLWCRDNDRERPFTRSRKIKRVWREVRKEDVAENELINANMNFLAACPVSPLIYENGKPAKFPGLD
ncbi:MAG: hypothetical protein M1814_002606 [Vezdaea aestivalis]|nr:MAG: hypothetical protein M1814_002606 [Vezdaea aestivalis]